MLEPIEDDTGTVITAVPVSGVEGGSAPREACPKIRQSSPSRCSLLYTSRTAGVPIPASALTTPPLHQTLALPPSREEEREL